MPFKRDMDFYEWKQEKARLAKRVANGGNRTSIPNPSLPMIPQRNQNVYSPTGLSRYNNERNEQPPNFIADVDENQNWYSPFQPIWPYGPPFQTRPVEWDYPIGYNLNYIQPRIELMSMLRAMRNSWGVLATIIATRQDQLLRIPWTIQQKNKPRSDSAAVKHMRQFFKKPDGIRSYGAWTRLITDDLLVLDAPCIFFSRNRGGQVQLAERLDPITIFPLIDDAGRIPTTNAIVNEDGIEYLVRQPAYQQIRKGLPAINLDASEVMYTPMRPKAEFPIFGYPGTEQILVEATEAILKTFYQKNFWEDGTIPDLIVTVPDRWTPNQIAMFQGHFDALLSGNLSLKSKVRFLPGGMKPFDIKNSSGESLWSQRDETLIRLACYAYSVSPAPFVKMLNRSTAQSAQQTAEEEGLFPFMSFWKDDIMDPIIQEKFGYDDAEFVFQPIPEPDGEKQAKIHDMKLKNGSMNHNEARAEDGLEPIPGGDVYTIQLGNVIVPVEMAARGEAATAAGFGTSTASNSGDSNRDEARTSAPPANKPSNSQPKGLARPNTGSNLPKPTPVHKTTYSQVKDAARGATEDLDTLSKPQIASGNYPKGHISIQGLDISIENKKGSKRGEKKQDGQKEFVRMPSPYGYIRGTVGADGSQVDVYLGKNPKSTTVWVIDQDKVTKNKGKNKGFDEHKVFVGYKNIKKVLKDYLQSHFDGRGHERLRDVTEISMDDFKDWLKNGNTKKPIAKQDYGKVVLTQDDLNKADTISSATNYVSYDQTSAKSKKRKRKSKLERGPRWLNLQASI